MNPPKVNESESRMGWEGAYHLQQYGIANQADWPEGNKIQNQGNTPYAWAHSTVIFPSQIIKLAEKQKQEKETKNQRKVKKIFKMAFGRFNPFFAAIIIFLLSGVAGAQEIEGQTTVEEHSLVKLSIKLAEGGSAVWDAVSITPQGFIDADGESVAGGSRYLFTGPPGRYRVTAMYVQDGAPGIKRTYVIIGNAPDPVIPDPVDPVDPDDPVDPPAPVVDPPIPGEGFRVMILYDTTETLSTAQQNILTSGTVIEYLRSKTAKIDNIPGYRFWSNRYEPSQIDHEPELWQTAYEKVKEAAESVPWIVAVNGNKVVSQPLPENVDAAMELLKSVGGE